MPDLAVSLPTPTDGGRTYTFRLRPNIRYSNGEPVRASDFRSHVRARLRARDVPAPYYYDGIVGAARCEKQPEALRPLARASSANDAARTVTFHLVAPDPEFLYKLALPFAYVVPRGDAAARQSAPIRCRRPGRT